MEHTTFAKKTVVLAALGALSLMAATARADGTETPSDPQPKNIEVTVGSGGVLGIASEIKNDETSVTWDNEWLEQKGVLGENKSFGGLTVKGEEGSKIITVTDKGSLTIDLPTQEATEAGNDEKVVTFNSVNLDVKDGGAFSNSSHVQITNGGSLTVTNGDFENGEGGVIELNGTKFDLSVTKAELVGNFENSGTIVLSGNASMTVGSDKVMDVTSDDELTLKVGNITIGKDAVLTNKDQGYRVQNKPEEQADTEGAEDDVAVDKTLVQFGTVSVADGGKFVNAADALSSGTKLVLEGANTVKIGEGGESVWNTLNLTKVDGTMNLSSFVAGIDDQSAQGDFRVTGALEIDEFQSSDSVFTIDGSNDDKDAKVFADGVDLTVGKHVSTAALKTATDESSAENELAWEKKPVVGTLTLQNFEAQSETSTEEPGTPEGRAEGEEGQTKPAESWTYKKFGDVTAYNTNILISENRTEVKDGYTPSLGMSSLSLVGTSMKIAYDVDVEEQAEAIKKAVQAAWDEVKGESTETIEWTEDNLLEQIESMLEGGKYSGLQEALEGKRSEFENKLAGVLNTPLDIESTVSGSDLSIGTLTIARNEIDDDATVKIENPFASGDGSASGAGTEGTEGQVEGDESGDEGDEGEAESKPVTITGSETYDVVNLKLAVSDSNLDVGTLDLQTGAITLKDSKMMVDNVKTLNGSLTLESGYLGLNVTKNIADLEDKKDEAETKADPDTAPAGATLELGSPVTIGESGKLTIGGADTTSDGTKVDYAISIAGTTDIVFDGRNFGSEALFSQTRSDGGKGLVVANGTDTKLNVKASNLSWGVYKLFDEDTLDTSALDDVTIVTDKSSASDLWEGATVKPDEGNQNQIVVGNKTIEGSGLEDIGAVNLMNSVFGGDRGSALDKRLVDAVLSNATSLEEISNTINSVTGLGAVAGLTAMAVDFGNYVADQVEHHAVTMPRQAEGWWVQPIAGKLKSDDLAVGGMKSGYSIDTFGIMGGFDRKLRNGDTIGVAASYQSGDADSEGSALPVSTDVTNYGFHLWHARELDAFRLMGMFSYSKTSGDAKMNVLGQEVTSDLGATEIAIGARADKEFKWGTVRMIPHAGVRASMIDVDDYTIEMGSEELFKVSEDKLWIFEVPVGVTFASSFEYARWNVQPYVDLTVRGRFGDTDSTFTLEGSNTSDSMKYDVTGDVIGDLRIGYMSTFQDLNLGMSYGLSAGDGGRQNHQIEATLRIDFN